MKVLGYRDRGVVSEEYWDKGDTAKGESFWVQGQS